MEQRFKRYYQTKKNRNLMLLSLMRIVIIRLKQEQISDYAFRTHA